MCPAQIQYWEYWTQSGDKPADVNLSCSTHSRCHIEEDDNKSIINVPEDDVLEATRKSTSSLTTLPGRSRQMPQRRAVKKLAQVKALWEFQSQDLDEISFDEGDTIDLIEEDESGWWKG